MVVGERYWQLFRVSLNFLDGFETLGCNVLEILVQDPFSSSIKLI